MGGWVGGRCVRYGRVGGWVGGRCVRYGRVCGFAKDDNRFGHEKWIQGGSIGVVAYEAKKNRETLLRNLHRRRKIFILFMM